MPIDRFRHVYYSPDDPIKDIVDRLPLSARTSIDCECYSFSDMALVENIITAARRGVTVRVMNDRSQSCGRVDKAALQRLVDAQLPTIRVKVVESSRHKIDHLKMLIIDGAHGAMADSSSVGQGSFNFTGDTAQAEDNLFIHENDPGVVAAAMAKFEGDWSTNPSRPEWQFHPANGMAAPARLDSGDTKR